MAPLRVSVLDQSPVAEGSTGSFFATFVLLANPTSTAATVRGTYLLSSGAPIVKTYTVAANSRRTLNVADEHASLANASVSIKFESTNAVPIVAERPLYFRTPLTGTGGGGTDVVGATAS